MRKPAKALVVLLFLFPACRAAAAPPSAELYHIVWKWLGGKSDSAYYFHETAHTVMLDRLKDAYQTRRAREFWYDKNMDTFNAGSRNWLGVKGFLGRFQTLRGLYRAGTDMVEQVIGGFTVNIEVTGDDSIRFTLHDIKSRWSLFLHLPFVSNIPYDCSREVQRNMSDCHWFFSWKEPIQTALFHQRRFNRMRFRHRNFTGHNF